MSIVFYRGTNARTGNSPTILPQSLLFHQNKVQRSRNSQHGSWKSVTSSDPWRKRDWACFFAFFLLSSLYYDVLKKDFKDCFKRRFCFSHEKFRGWAGLDNTVVETPLAANTLSSYSSHSCCYPAFASTEIIWWFPYTILLPSELPKDGSCRTERAHRHQQFQMSEALAQVRTGPILLPDASKHLFFF